MSLRCVRRTLALAAALALCAVRYWLARLCGPLSLEQRALWLQSASRGVLASLDISANVEGTLPSGGLVVSNHLSYLDIVLFAAVTPCFFVAKREVSDWPFFGKAAEAGGSIFLDRSSLASANAAAEELAHRLALAVPVLLFPEGTSTDGSAVLRFHSRLFLPAAKCAAPVTAAAIRYLPEDGAEERDLCWYGDAGFLGHLWKVLGASGFSVQIRFGPPCIYRDARNAAEQTRTEIEAMRQEYMPRPCGHDAPILQDCEASLLF